MSLPISPNTTVDIYRAANMPPNPPDVAAVPCFLKPDFRGGKEASDMGQTHSWTHVMLIDSTVDIRDWYLAAGNVTQQDYVFIPDQNGWQFIVVFAELVLRGSAHEHVRVFLDRNQQIWPMKVP